MSSSSAVYSHRPMHPSGARVQPTQDPPPYSIVNPLETIKRMFEGAQEELARERSQKDDMEAQLNSQVSELNTIRRALFDLEVEHNRVCQQYEDELHRLRSESVAILQASAPPPHQSPAALGIPGRARGPGLSDTSSRFPGQHADHAQHVHHTHLHHQHQSQPHSQHHSQHRPLSRGMPPPGDRESDQGDRKRANSSDRETDRLSDHRESKRHKARRDNHSEMYPPPMGVHSHSHSPHQPHASGSGSGSGSSGVKPSSSSYNHNILSPYRFPGQDTGGPPSSSSSTLPPVNLTSPREDQLIPQNVPPEFRKDGGDWSVIYNPKVRKSLDVNLVHTFVHDTVVCCVQFSSDGRYLATGCNRMAQIYDVQSGAKVCVLEDETAPKDRDLYIRSVRFSPDGKLLATGAEDSKIRVWDIARRRVRHCFEGHNQEIYSLDFSRDGRHIVSGSGDKTMRIWDVIDKSCRTITITDADSLNNDAGVTSVAISPDGSLVAAGSLDSPVRVWDVATGTLLERLRGHVDSVYSVAFTPDGKGIVSGSLDKTLKYWDITNLVNTFSKRIKPDQTRDISRSPLAISPPSSASLNFVGHKDYVLSVCISEDTRWVVSGSKDRTVHFWDGKTSALQFMLHGHKNSVISLDLNPLGGMLATGSGDTTARIWTFSPTSAPLSSSSHSFNQ